MSSLPAFDAYTDEKLEAARVAVAAEVERRYRLAEAPAQIAAVAKRFIADGGDKTALVQAVENADAPEPEPEPEPTEE